MRKHPPNAYMLFVSAERSLTQNEFPEKTPKEIMTVLSDKWKKMSEDQKTPYKNAYAARMKDYNAPLAKLPKKPPGVFGLFVKEKYPIVESGKPEAGAPEIMSAISDEWNSLSEEKKEEWKQKREKLIQQYKEQVMNFGNGMTAEERAFLKEKRGPEVQKIEKEKRVLLGYPKRPPSPFIIFIQKNPDEVNLENVPVVERTKMMGKKWREMSDVEKEVYFEENRNLREKYRKDVTDWMANNPQDA